MRLKGQIPIFNIDEEYESLLLQQVEELVGGKSLLFVASVSYVDVEDSVFDSIFVGAHDDLGSISYHAALVQRSYLNMKQIQVGEQIWEIPADTWTIYWTAEDGIVFSSEDIRICTIRCDEEESLYDLIEHWDQFEYEHSVAELSPEGSSELAEPIATVQGIELEQEPVMLTIEEWLVEQYSMMSVEQILQSIDEWSTEVLREVYQYELLGRSRPKVLSKVIEYLGYVGEDPRTPEPESFQQVDTQLTQKAVYGIDLDWDAVVIDKVEYILYKVDRTSDGGRTWDYIMTTYLLRYTDESATSGIEDLYRITPYNGNSPVASPVYRSHNGNSPAASPVDSSPSMPFLGKIPLDIKQRNATVLSRDKGTLQVHCPYCGVFTEKEIYSHRKFNRAIDNTNRANDLQRKAQKRQRKAEKIIAMGDRLSFSAGGAMRANQIETNHMIQDQLRGSPANALRHLVNDAEVQCRNCGKAVNEI